MKKVSAYYSKGLFQVTFAVVVALLLSVSLVQGVTTISTNIATDGTLSVTGLATFLGGATTTTLTLLNGAVISEATDGVVQINATASTTGITLLNGEMITNTTDGTIALTGAMTVSGASTFTGLGTFLGGATTTTLTLLNGEVISNAIDGVIQLGGIASSTSITLLNGETITNAVDGTVALTGAFTISSTLAVTGATTLSSTLAVSSATSTMASTTITALSVGSTTPVQYGIANAVIDSAGAAGTTTLKIAAPGALVAPCIEMETTGGVVVRLYATSTGAIAYWEAGACK